MVRRIAWGASWAAALAALALCAAWLFSGSRWEVDLVANLTAQSALGAFGLAIWWLIRRRWARMGVALAALALASTGVAWAPRAERGAIPSDPARLVRVLTMNAYAWSRNPAGLMSLLEATDADVVTILEPPLELVKGMRASPTLQAKFPHRHLPEHAEAGSRIMLSRWPAERLRRRSLPPGTPEPAGDWRYHGRSWRIDAPSPFVLSMIHPESPRTRVRWEQGNQDIDMLEHAMTHMIAPLGLPVVLAGDFNSTPTGWRSRELSRRTGLRRAKPWWAPVGTWPAWSVWPARIAIDDVMVSPGVGVIAWELHTPPPEGRKGVRSSDHVPVKVRLLLPE
ncbi:MAG: endonuclease/exonuclease/phosphatase family protein [Phycisphaerales bacterium]|nr:endonuclease/exonuclease/phosphatase family protein [Phycisphaerales bacterium]